MKKIISLFLLAHISICLHAVEFTYNGLNYSILSEEDKTCEVARNQNASGVIAIPASAEFNGAEYSVIAIGEGAFFFCLSLTSIDIPNSVISIKDSAFGYCSSLTSVNIPNSVTTIGNSAFCGCSALTSVNIPNSVTWIRGCAFEICLSLKSVEIPNSVTIIEGGVFRCCSSLTSVVIPNSVKSIGVNSFAGCSSLISIDIPNSVTSIGDYAFSDCSSLTSVEIPCSVTSIGAAAFYGCTALMDINVSSDNTAFSSMDGVLYNKEKTELIVVPAGKSDSFSIPNSVNMIGYYSFSGCSALISVYIPNSITWIGDYAFRECTKLSEVYCFIVEPIYLWRYTFSDETYHGTLHVPVGTKEAYEAAEGWREFANIVDDLVDGEEGPSISHSEIVIAADEVFQLGVNDWEGEISWSSSDPSVAYVNECGLVVAMGIEGTSTITASTGEEELICGVSVIGTSGGFFGDDLELIKPEKIKIESICTNPPMLNVRLEPVGACTTIDWTSTDESIATVDRGLVSAYAVGTVVLCAETQNGLQAFITVSTDDLPLGVGDIPADGGAPGSNDVYDITGRCILSHATREQINALRPGIYFLNGKKVRL